MRLPVRLPPPDTRRAWRSKCDSYVGTMAVRLGLTHHPLASRQPVKFGRTYTRAFR